MARSAPLALALLLLVGPWLPGQRTTWAAKEAGKKKSKKADAKGKKSGAKGKKAGAKKTAKGPKKVTGGPPGTSQSGPAIPRASKPTVDSWGVEDVEEMGRIVGSLKHCPGCHIEVLAPLMTAVKMMSVRRGDPDFTVEWLEPDTYTLRFTGGGYSLTVPNVSVNASSDTFVSVDFPPGSDKSGKAKAGPVRVERWPTWHPPLEPKIPVRNFKPKSFRELDRMWKGVDLTPGNHRKSSGRKSGRKGKRGRRRNRRK